MKKYLVGALKRAKALNELQWPDMWQKKSVLMLDLNDFFKNGFATFFDGVKNYVVNSRAERRAIDVLHWSDDLFETSARRLRYYVIRRPSDGAFYVGSTTTS